MKTTQEAGNNPATATLPHPCPGCGGTAGRPFRSEGGYTIYRCGTCTLGFLWPQPGPQAQEALYGEAYFGGADGITRGYDSYLSQEDNLRATFRDRLRVVPWPATGRTLLDVGAATGHFVEQARAAGFDAQGIEFSPWAAGYARDRLRVPVRTGTLEAAGFPDGSFDVVTMWEVIEHLPDPRAVLREVARVVKPGGWLHLSTPDAGSLVARLAGWRWLGWRKIPEHLFYFDLPSLQRLLRDCGFTLVSHRYVSLTVTAAYALERLGAMAGMRWIGNVPEGIGRRAVRINCYYDLMVSARREAGA